MKAAWKIIAAIVAVVVIAFAVFLMTFDISKYKGLIQEQAKAATGRDVEIGDIKMAVSLTPTVVLKNVSVSNASWGSQPQMMTVKSIDAKLELLPLLSKQVNITSIKLDGADMLLETDKSGQGNWVFQPQGQAQNAGASQQSSLNVQKIDGTNLKVTMKDGKTGEETDAAVKSMAMQMRGALQDMNVANFTMSDATVSQREGANNSQVTIGKVSLDSNGPLADLALKKLDISDVKVIGKNGDSALNAEVSKVSLDDKGNLDVEGKYNGGDFSAKGTVAGLTDLKNKKQLPMKLALQGMGLNGNVDLTVDASQKPTLIKGTINIPEIDMTKYAPRTSSTGAAPSAPAKGAPAQPMFSNEPLPWASLQNANADVTVTIGTVKLADGQAITNLNLPIKLSNGQLAMNGASLQMAGGTLHGDIDANAGTKAVTIKAGAKGLTAEGLAKAYKRGDLITGGPIDLALDVHGSGVSPHAIAASLSGSVLAGMGESKINNSAMKMGAAQSLLQIITTSNPFASKEPYTVAKCAVFNFQIANGIADTENGVAFITDKVQGTGSGKINLGEDRVDMIIKPKVSGAIGSQVGKLASTLKVTGTMEDPSIGVDAASTAKAVGGLALGVATGGAAGGLLGLNGGSSSSGGGGVLGSVGGVFGKKKSQSTDQGTQTAQASTSHDVCAAARAWHH